MEKLPQISEAEYEIMKIIWADYPINTNDVCEKANLTHSWNQKTIHTLLTRLNAKKVISYDQRGRMYYYYPLISQKKISGAGKSALPKPFLQRRDGPYAFLSAIRFRNSGLGIAESVRHDSDQIEKR